MILIFIPVLVFAVLWLQGATLGLTDDEAYYWVLSLKLQSGYAYHPPAVAWVIAFFRAIFGSLLGSQSSAGIRLPAAVLTAAVVGLLMHWMSQVSDAKRLASSAFILLALPGIFGSAWMMVPDVPLLLGWTLAFVFLWKALMQEKAHLGNLLLFGSGIVLALLSKYSAVLIVISCLFSIISFKASKDVKIKLLCVLFLSAFIAAFPTVLSNIQNGWSSLRYQLNERHHTGGPSLLRYSRFWFAETFLAGPVLIAFGFVGLFKILKAGVFSESISARRRYLFLWAFPAALIFCIQPLFSDFKLHWVFVVWLPIAIEMACLSADGAGRWKKAIRFQRVYGFSIILFVFLMCHLPIVGFFSKKITGHSPDPRWDVTNDMYGWSHFPQFVKARLGKQGLEFPVVGSRYQTASQASVAWPRPDQVTLLPRTQMDLRDWPVLNITDHPGPGWTNLLRPVLFVADNRYSDGPHFGQASCLDLGSFSDFRGPYLAKTIRVWKCQPSAERTF